MKKLWLIWETKLWPSNQQTVTLPSELERLDVLSVKKFKYSRRPRTSIGRLTCFHLGPLSRILKTIITQRFSNGPLFSAQLETCSNLFDLSSQCDGNNCNTTACAVSKDDDVTTTGTSSSLYMKPTHKDVSPMKPTEMKRLTMNCLKYFYSPYCQLTEQQSVL